MVEGAPERMLGTRVKHLGETGFYWLIGIECGKRGPRVRAYRDSRGIPTIGVGQTEIKRNGKWRRVEMTDSFSSVEEATAAFAHTVTLYEAAVDGATRDDITQTTFDAMTSFCYNIGISGFKNSDAVRLLNQMMPVDEVANAMLANWHRPPEVVERRHCEMDLLVRGVYRLQGQVL